MSSVIKRDLKIYYKLKNFAKYFLVPDGIQSNPFQTWVTIAHYKWAVGIIVALTTCIISSWFATSPMECVAKSIASASHIAFSESDLCLSYSYAYTSGRDMVPRNKIYPLHYRWVHWAFLILILLYSVPLVCRQRLEKPVISYMKQLQSMKKDNQQKELLNKIIYSYVLFSAYMYRDLLILLFTTLFVDIVAFIFIDIVLQNKFARLIPLDYPFERFYQQFNDTLSLAFPPYVECTIGPPMKIYNNMEKKFGCHLPLMILYEKIFVVMWILMVLLTIWSFLTLGYYLLLQFCPCLKRSLIYIKGCEDSVNTCIRELPTGCIAMMSCLKNILDNRQYKLVVVKTAFTLKKEAKKIVKF